MPSKLENIVNLYRETLSDISKSPENWTSFLLSASNNYKYQFQNQVLIFVQRPDAIACADIDTWNKRVRRWVNKGAKGIALLDEVNGRNTLKYVFDVTDTHNYYRTELMLWKMKDEYQDKIIESLEAKFGMLENKADLEQTIISASYNSVEDNIQDYLQELIYSKENSFLEEMEDFNIEVDFRVLLSNSVIFMTLNRCGINPFDYFSVDDFRAITNFNTIDIVSILGAATSDIAENQLREIHRTINNLKENEKNKNHTFVKNEKIIDNIEKQIERSENYDNNIQTSGDYQIPNLMIEEMNQNQFQGKYYQMRLNYLKEHRKGLYTALIIKNKLTEHLIEIQKTATTRLNQIIKELMIKENITEELKEKDQMTWVQMMNNIKNSAEEIIFQEIIYN